MTYRTRLWSMSAMASILLAFSATGSMAQGGAPPADVDEPGLAEDCRAQPDAAPEGESDAAPEDLSERLARCGGVLAPPTEGDPDIVAPAPDTGTTPVLPPEAAPEQPPG